MRVRRLPFGLQVIKFNDYLLKRGVSPDLVDTKNVIDRNLGFRENKKLMGDYLGFNIFPQEIKGRVSSYELYEKAQQINNKRKRRNLSTDNRLRAKNTFYPDSITQKEYMIWRKNPNRNDIEGIDTQGWI